MLKKAPKKILVVDDDLGMLRLLEKWLNVSQYEIHEASTGELGLLKVKELNPDLVLLDVMLPDIGGVEVARRMLAGEDTKNIPIIFMSVCVGVENDKGTETIVVGDREYRIFAKPLHNPRLLSEIRKTINRRIHNNPFSPSKDPR